MGCLTHLLVRGVGAPKCPTSSELFGSWPSLGDSRYTLPCPYLSETPVSEAPATAPLAALSVQLPTFHALSGGQRSYQQMKARVQGMKKWMSGPVSYLVLS